MPVFNCLFLENPIRPPDPWIVGLLNGIGFSLLFFVIGFQLKARGYCCQPKNNEPVYEEVPKVNYGENRRLISTLNRYRKKSNVGQKSKFGAKIGIPVENQNFGKNLNFA